MSKKTADLWQLALQDETSLGTAFERGLGGVLAHFVNSPAFVLSRVLCVAVQDV